VLVIYWKFANWNFLKINQIGRLKKTIIKLYSSGFHLLLGNLSHQLSLNIDKLFFSIFYSSQLFGYYAFGATFFVLANIALSSISTFILPYLFRNKLNNTNYSYDKVISYPLKLLPFYILYFLIIRSIITYFYPEYIESFKYFVALYLALVLNISISIIQNNFLKSLFMERIYSKSNFTILFILILGLYIIYFYGFNNILIPIAVSGSFLLRYQINDYFILKKLKIPKFQRTPVFWLLLNVLFYGIAIYTVL